MTIRLNSPLEARNGHTLEGLIACRVSNPGPGKQDIRSLDDQEAEHSNWVATHTDLPSNLTVVAGSGSGEWLERDEYFRLIELVESQRFDFVLTEDLGRIVRRIHAHLFCELCVDNGVRLIALNDHVDTAEPGWEDRSIFSAWHHERSNRDTSDRIKRTHRNRFQNGGCLSLPIFGYVKQPGARGDDDLQKDPEAEKIYEEWFERLDDDKAATTYSDIADWLNSEGVPTGPYCRLDEWDCAMVSRITHNWLLKGVRFRNKRKTRRINKTGKYKSEKADPEELLTRRVAELAFFSEAYYDRVVAKADARNAKYRRKDDGQNGGRRRSNKRTPFPGQSVYCGVCGRLYVMGGHGQKDRLMCSGAHNYKCWNAISFDGPQFRTDVTRLILDEISKLPAFEPEFLAMLREEIGQLDSRRARGEQELDIAEHRLNREIANLMGVFREHGSSAILLSELRRLESSQEQLAIQRDELSRRPVRNIKIPTIECVQQFAREEFDRLAAESFEFASLMRRVLPSIYVFPYRLCDGGHIVLRAKITFTALPFVSADASQLDGLSRRLSSGFVVDLFRPPQREEFRSQIVEILASREEVTQRQMAARLGVTLPVVQRARRLSRQMESIGVTDAYIPLREPPDDYPKMRRHLRPRFKFTPLDGFPGEWPE